MQIQYVDDQRSDYRPGACNIGPAEIARRRQGGLLAIAVAVGVAVALVVVDAPPAWRLLVFPFLAAGFNTLEQARRRFCVGFAMAGVRDFGPAGERTVVQGRDERAADRRAALILSAYTAAAAAIVSLGFVALPI